MSGFLLGGNGREQAREEVNLKQQRQFIDMMNTMRKHCKAVTCLNPVVRGEDKTPGVCGSTKWLTATSFLYDPLVPIAERAELLPGDVFIYCAVCGQPLEHTWKQMKITYDAAKAQARK